MKKEVVSIYVDNKANVLTRVVSLYGRRGFNIDSLTVSATNDPDISRITVTFEGDNLKRSFFRELLMVKVSAGKEMRKEIKEIVDIYRAKIISLTKEEMVLELTGAPEKLDAFLDMLTDYNITDICRTGVTGIEK